MIYLLEAKTRKGPLTPLERINNIAGIFYGKDIKENIMVTIHRKEFMHFLGAVKKDCYTSNINLKINSIEYAVIIKDIQWHKLTTNPEHIDFFSIKNVEKIQVNYNIQYINKDTCNGVKQGGKLYIRYRQCKGFVNPHKMSPYLEIDLQNVKIGEKIQTEFLENKYRDMNLNISNKAILVSITS
jgi:large subunit ribosomal protein L25